MTVFLHCKKFKYHHGFVSQETEMVCMEHTDLSLFVVPASLETWYKAQAAVDRYRPH